jgi:co-chaperonin GroES (HSP10)
MFKPVNRYILIKVMAPRETEGESLIVLPEDYKPAEEQHSTVVVVKSAEDVRFDVPEGAQLVVDRSMIEEISAQGTIYNVILDNYVLGIIE